ncbi:hypothetical protein ACF1AX_31380 [Streptomyces sp. NPDC014802]|uniref:hypothetical protein n=1 Tax=Streptomyces sp. NPDC014802 TaxID=3364917 RepID=UPI0036FF4053
MSRHVFRAHTDHQHAAQQARELPHQWVLAGTYGSRASAVSAALQVRTGERIPAYRPAGAFEARTEVTADGADLYVRYIDPAATAAAFRQSVEAGFTEDLAAFTRRLDAAATSKDT